MLTLFTRNLLRTKCWDQKILPDTNACYKQAASVSKLVPASGSSREIDQQDLLQLVYGEVLNHERPLTRMDHPS